MRAWDQETDLLAVGELLHAMAHGPTAIDSWIEAWSVRERSEPARGLGQRWLAGAGAR